jgi:hypothetical protein
MTTSQPFSPTPGANHPSSIIRYRFFRRLPLTVLKLFLLAVVTMMIRVQIPELRYDFGSHEPAEVASTDDLSLERFPQPAVASVEGTPDLTKAARYATHGVPFSYFLLEGYGPKLVVRTPEKIDRDWTDINIHIGRLRPYHRMPFSRSVRAGFQQLFDVRIPEDAFFLARDDVPRPSGWTLGAVIFASVLWCVLAYFFFLRRHVGKVFAR